MLGADNGARWAVAVAPSDSDVVWIMGSDVTYRTTDGGVTWSQLPGLTTPWGTFGWSYGHPLAVDPADPGTVYAGWLGGVSRHSAATEGWESLNAGLPNRNVLAVALDPADPTRLIAGTFAGGIYELPMTPASSFPRRAAPAGSTP